MFGFLQVWFFLKMYVQQVAQSATLDPLSTSIELVWKVLLE
jgi:hypothetical protein